MTAWKLPCCTCNAHFCPFLWRDMANDKVKFPNWGFNDTASFCNIFMKTCIPVVESFTYFDNVNWRERSEIPKILRQPRTLLYSHVAIVSVFSFHIWREGDLLKVVFLPTDISWYLSLRTWEASVQLQWEGTCCNFLTEMSTRFLHSSKACYHPFPAEFYCCTCLSCIRNSW